MTSLFNITTDDNIIHMEKTYDEMMQMAKIKTLVAVETLKYTMEDKIRHCKQFGSN